MKKLLNEQAFTLVEMLLVLLIISILLLIAVPNMTKNSSVANDKVCEATIAMIQAQIAAYEVETNKKPDSLQVLLDEGYVDRITCPDQTTLVLNKNTWKVEKNSSHQR